MRISASREEYLWLFQLPNNQELSHKSTLLSVEILHIAPDAAAHCINIALYWRKSIQLGSCACYWCREVWLFIT